MAWSLCSGDFSRASTEPPICDPVAQDTGPACLSFYANVWHCFGHQLIGYWGEAYDDPSRSELGTVQVSKPKRVKYIPCLLVSPIRLLRIQVIPDVVLGCPEGCDIILSNDLLDTQAFQVRQLPMMSVQFHPDMTGAEARARLLAYKKVFLIALRRMRLALPRSLPLIRTRAPHFCRRFSDCMGFRDADAVEFVRRCPH